MDKQIIEMTPHEKADYRNRLIVVLCVSLIMTLSVPLIIAIRFRRLGEVWGLQQGRYQLVLMLFNSIVFLAIPAALLFKIFRRKTNQGSYFPTNEELQKYRIRRRMPQALWKRALAAAFNFAIALYYTFDPTHLARDGKFRWFMAGLFWVLAAITTSELFRPSTAQSRSATRPLRDG